MPCECVAVAGPSSTIDRCICGDVDAPLLPLLVQSVGVQHLQVASPGRLLSAHAGSGGNRHGASEGMPPRMPPPLRRQHASRFSWPPDRQQEWVYIRLSPVEFVEQASFSLDLQLTVRQVCELFVAEEQDSAAYARYAVMWRAEIDAGLLGG